MQTKATYTPQEIALMIRTYWDCRDSLENIKRLRNSPENIGSPERDFNIAAKKLITEIERQIPPEILRERFLNRLEGYLEPAAKSGNSD